MVRRSSKLRQFEVTRDEIFRLCSYVSSDASVAAYFGIPVERVTKLRAAMPKPVDRRFLASRNEPEAQSSGQGEAIRFRYKAEEGSTQLRDAIQALFARWEAQHGFKPGAGELLLPAGWNEQRKGRVA